MDNTTTYVYGGDLRGNLWRFSFLGVPGTAPSSMLMGTLYDAASRPQPITTKPELTRLNGNRVVFVGTGRYLGLRDLTDPMTWTPPSTDAYQQSFYAIKDTGVGLGNVRTSGNLVQQAFNAAGSTTTNAVDWNTKNGWYIDFNTLGDAPGERMNIDPQLVLGTLVFKTNVPNVNACVSGGDSFSYQLRYDTGTYVSTAPSQIARQKITGALTVGFVIVGLPGGGLKDITTTSDGSQKVFGIPVGGGAGLGKPIGWRELTQ